MMKYGLVILAWMLAACQAISASLAAPIVIEWTTASEINTAGFNLYRSAGMTDPFTRINAHLIPASNDPVLGGKYRYEDADVTPGQVYLYQLEDVELTGTTTRHEPIAVTAAARADENATLIAVTLGVVLAVVGLFVGSRRRPFGFLKTRRV